MNISEHQILMYCWKSVKTMFIYTTIWMLTVKQTNICIVHIIVISVLIAVKLLQRYHSLTVYDMIIPIVFYIIVLGL